MSLADALRRAADPLTPLTELQELAQNVPQTRPLIAANPATYPALLDWLAEFGDPDIDAALARRRSAAVSSSPEDEGALAATPAPATPAAPGASATTPAAMAATAPQAANSGYAAAQLPHGGGAQAASPQPEPRPKSSATRVVAWIFVLILTSILVTALLGIGLWAAGKRDGGLGAFVDRVITGQVFAHAPAGHQQLPDADQNPAGAQRPGTEAAQAKLAGTRQFRQVIAPPTPTTTQVKPVPPAAYTNITEFTVGGGTTWCTLQSNVIRCTVRQTSHDYGNKGGPLRLQVVSGGTFEMSDPGRQPALPQGLPELAAGAAAAVNDMTCLSKGASVDCWDAASGHGFVAGVDVIEQY